MLEFEAERASRLANSSTTLQVQQMQEPSSEDWVELPRTVPMMLLGFADFRAYTWVTLPKARGSSASGSRRLRGVLGHSIAVFGVSFGSSGAHWPFRGETLQPFLGMAEHHLALSVWSPVLELRVWLCFISQYSAVLILRLLRLQLRASRRLAQPPCQRHAISLR